MNASAVATAATTPSHPPVAMAGATMAASTAPGMCRIHAATNPVEGSRSANKYPVRRMPKVTAAMPRMVTRTSGDTVHLEGLDDAAGETAGEPAQEDVPIAGNEH